MLKYRLQSSLATMVLCLFVSCSSPKQEGMKDIMKLPTYSVEGVKFNQEEIISGNAWEFHRVGDNFLIFNAVPTSAALVIRMADCKELGEFMPKGMGPGECNTPRYAGCSAGEDTIYMYDTFKFGMSEFAFPSQREESLQYSFIRTIRSTQDELHGPTCRLDNGLSVGFRLSGTRHLFSLLDERMDTIRTFGSLPLPVEDDELKNFMPFQGVMTAKGNTVFYASKLLPYMCAYEVIDANNIELKFKYNYQEPSYTYSNGRIRMDHEKTLEAFRDIKLNRGYIWATFLGLSFAEVTEDPNGKGDCQSIILFNMKGEPLAKFELPVKGSHFCFSKDGNQLYLFTTDSDIYSFEVNDFLKHIE